MKRNLLTVIFLFVWMMVLDWGGWLAGEDDWTSHLLSMTVPEYQRYVKTHAPLDRLFCQDGRLYFLKARTADDPADQLKGTDDLFRGVSTRRVEQGSDFNVLNGAYHSYLESEAFLLDLQARFPDLARLTVAGKSVEGRNLYILKISDQVAADENEPNFYLFGCHHSREWISVEVPLYIARYLLESYASDTQVRNIVDHMQIYVMPVQNPDGLEYSIRCYQMWRKNRRYNGSYVFGVDVNRNFGYHWGEDNAGSSPDPQNVTYRGPAAFSEPESRAVRDFMLLHPPAGGLNFHNFSQTIVYPWGYTLQAPPDAAVLWKLAAGMAREIQAVNGRMYTYGQSGEAMYLTNGDMDDWIYGTFHVPIFTIELPPRVFLEGGFFINESGIQEIVAEMIPAVRYFCFYLDSKLRKP